MVFRVDKLGSVPTDVCIVGTDIAPTVGMIVVGALWPLMTGIFKGCPWAMTFCQILERPDTVCSSMARRACSLEFKLLT